MLGRFKEKKYFIAIMCTLLVFSLGSTFLTGCSSSSKKRFKRRVSKSLEKPRPKLKPTTRTNVSRGKEAFERLCIKCHSKTGEGGGIGEGVLGAPICDLSNKAYMTLLTDDELYDRVAHGNDKVPYIVMPGWKSQLSKSTIMDIISYIRTLEKDKGPLVGLSPQQKIERYKKDPLERGRVNYLRYCSSCHGFKGKGDGWATEIIASKPINFSSHDFPFQYEKEKIFNYVKGIDQDKEKMAKRVMPVFGKSITNSVIEDIVAYIYTFSKDVEPEYTN